MNTSSDRDTDVLIIGLSPNSFGSDRQLHLRQRRPDDRGAVSVLLERLCMDCWTDGPDAHHESRIARAPSCTSVQITYMEEPKTRKAWQVFFSAIAGG